jgi:sulfite reductase (ferredoxin)
VPSKAVPNLVTALTDRYVAEKINGEDFQTWCQRVGKKSLKETVDRFKDTPPHTVDASFYTDWGDVREFTIGDMAAGECAGELVSPAQFGFTQAETEAFEAQLLLDDAKYNEADYKAYHAMLTAAKTLVQLQWLDVPNEPNVIVEEFRKRFVETKLFWDPYHGDQFSRYLFLRHGDGPDTRYTKDTAHKLVEEANLFIDAAHKAHMKWQESLNVVNVPVEAAASERTVAVPS